MVFLSVSIYCCAVLFSEYAFSLTTKTFFTLQHLTLVFVLRQNTLKDSWCPSFVRIPNHIELCLENSACACINARMHKDVDLPASSRESPFIWPLGNYVSHFAFHPFPQPQWVNINCDLRLNFPCFYTCLNPLIHILT